MVSSRPPTALSPVSEASSAPFPLESTQFPELDLLGSLLGAITNLRNRNSRLQFQPNIQAQIRNVEFPRNQFVEAFRQNTNQINSLVRCMVPAKEKYYAGRIHAFNFTKLQHQIGDWIDVKDAMGNWLEAQITDLTPEKVYVHYNGWGSAWDEWISLDSPRLAIFRSHSVESPDSGLHCMNPHIAPDGTFTGLAPPKETFDEILKKFVGSTETVAGMLKTFLNEPNEDETEKKNSRKFMGAQLAPLLDRVGRIMQDLSKHFGTIAYEDYASGAEVVQLPRFPGGDDGIENVAADPVVGPEAAQRIECQVGFSPAPGELSKFGAAAANARPTREIHLHQIIIARGNEQNTETGVGTHVENRENVGTEAAVPSSAPVLGEVSNQVANRGTETTENTVLDCDEILHERLREGEENDSAQGEELRELFREPQDNDKENK